MDLCLADGRAGAGGRGRRQLAAPRPRPRQRDPSPSVRPCVVVRSADGEGGREGRKRIGVIASPPPPPPPPRIACSLGSKEGRRKPRRLVAALFMGRSRREREGGRSEGEAIPAAPQPPRSLLPPLPDGSHRSSESDPTRFTAFLLPSGSFTYDVRTEGEGVGLKADDSTDGLREWDSDRGVQKS